VLEIIHPGDSVVPRHTRPFMPIDQVQSYLTQNDNLELLSIIKELSLETELYPKDILRRYTAVFCTLLQSGHGEYIELFRHKSSLSDRSLPFSVHNPPPGFPSGTEESNMLADFCREQWRFCAAVIEDSDSDKHYEEDQVLPIIYKERLAGGGTANLWLIKLHPTYNQIVPDAVIPVSKIWAVLRNNADIEREWKNFKTTRTPLYSKSIVRWTRNHTTTMRSQPLER